MNSVITGLQFINEPVTTAEDDILIFFFVRENKA